MQIADHTGPVGLYTPGFTDYFKSGFYNWSDTKSVKKLLFRSFVMANDPTGDKYKPEDFTAFIQSH